MPLPYRSFPRGAARTRCFFVRKRLPISLKPRAVRLSGCEMSSRSNSKTLSHATRHARRQRHGLLSSHETGLSNPILREISRVVAARREILRYLVPDQRSMLVVVNK
jgi:hypothetical protein